MSLFLTLAFEVPGINVCKSGDSTSVLRESDENNIEVSLTIVILVFFIVIMLT